MDQQHQVQHQATTQKSTCGRVTSDVEKQLDVLLDQQSQASKNAKKLDDRLRKASQAKEEKSMLLVQLQEQGEEDGTATASATEKKTAHSADPQDSSPASSSTTPIKVITSSLAEGQVQVKKLQLQRHAAYAAVEDAKARVSVTTRHAAEITQECTQQQFVFEELIERLEDRGKAVHEMLEAVHEKRLNIKIFLDEAQRASGGARLPRDLIETAQNNGGCLWACTRYKQKDGLLINVDVAKEEKSNAIPIDATCVKCSEDGVLPLPPFVLKAMSGASDEEIDTVNAVKMATDDVQTLLSEHALEAIHNVGGSAGPTKTGTPEEEAAKLSNVLNTNPNKGALTHLDSASIKKTHEAAVTSIQKSHQKALAQIKRAVTMAYLHQTTATAKGNGKHAPDDEALGDALAVAREGASELLHATHEEAVARIQAEHQASLNKIGATQEVALQSMGVFGAGSERIATAKKIRAQHQAATSHIVQKHKATMQGIASRMKKHHEKTTKAVQAIRKEHAAAAESIDNRHEAAVGKALGAGGQGGAVQVDESVLLSAVLHGVQGDAVLVPASGLDLALDSSLLRCRFGLNANVPGSRVLQIHESTDKEEKPTRKEFLKCTVPEWAPTMNGGQPMVPVLGSIDGGQSWFGKDKVTLTYGIPVDVKEETEEAVNELQQVYDQWKNTYTAMYAKLNQSNVAQNMHSLDSSVVKDHTDLEKNMLHVRQRRDQARLDLNAATVAFSHYVLAKKAAVDLYSLSQNVTFTAKRAALLKQQSDDLRTHAHEIYATSETVIGNIEKQIDGKVNDSTKARVAMENQEEMLTTLLLVMSDLGRSRIDVAAELRPLSVTCAKYKATFDADTATVSDLELQLMAPGKSTEDVTSRRMSAAALPKAKAAVLMSKGMFQPCLVQANALKQRLASMDRDVAKKEAQATEFRSHIKNIRTSIEDTETETNELRSTMETAQGKLQWSMRAMKEAAYNGHRAEELELTTNQMKDTKKTLLEAKEKSEIAQSNAASKDVKNDGRINNFLRPWGNQVHHEILPPNTADDCVGGTGRRVGPAMHPCGTKAEMGEGPIEIVPTITAVTGPADSGTGGATGGATGDVTGGATGSAATGSATGSASTGSASTGSASADPLAIARKHGCEVDISERWCPSMELCYRWMEGADQSACPTLELNPSHMVEEVIVRYPGIIDDNNATNATDGNDDAIVDVPCFEDDGETPCAFNNNPIVLVEAMQVVRRRRDYVRSQLLELSEQEQKSDEDQEELDKWEDKRDQYGRSENLIVRRFAKVCNDRNDVLDTLNEQATTTRQELKRRHQTIQASDVPMPGVQKVVDALDRDLQSVETQMDDSKDDVVECDQQRELWEIFSNHSGYTATKHQDEHDDDEEEEEKDLVVPVVPVHMKGSLQLRGAIPARVVLFRKSIRSIIAEVLQVNTMQVHVNVNEPTTEGGNAYSVDIKFGTREEALHDATVIRRSNHNETNKHIVGALHAEGLISLKSVSLAMEPVEGDDKNSLAISAEKDAAKRNANKNAARNAKLQSSECKIRTNELTILNRLASSLKHRYISIITLNQKRKEFVKLVKRYGAIRKQVKYDLKYITLHNCPMPKKAHVPLTDASKKAVTKAADQADSQLLPLAGLSSAIAAAQHNFTRFNVNATVNGTNGTNGTNMTTSTNNTSSNSAANATTAPIQQVKVATSTGNVSIPSNKLAASLTNTSNKMVESLSISGLPNPALSMDELESALSTTLNVDLNTIIITEIAPAEEEEEEDATSMVRFKSTRSRRSLSNLRSNANVFLELEENDDEDDEETKDEEGNIVTQEIEDGETKTCRDLYGLEDARKNKTSPVWCYAYVHDKQACENHYVSSTQHRSKDPRTSKLRSVAACDFDQEDGSCTRSNWIKCGSGQYHDQYSITFEITLPPSELGQQMEVKDTLARLSDPEDTTGSMSSLTTNMATSLHVNATSLAIVVQKKPSKPATKEKKEDAMAPTIAPATTKDIETIKHNKKATLKFNEATTLKTLAGKLLSRKNISGFDRERAEKMMERADDAESKAKDVLFHVLKESPESTSSSSKGKKTSANKPILQVKDANEKLYVARGEEKAATLKLEQLVNNLDDATSVDDQTKQNISSSLLKKLHERQEELANKTMGAKKNLTAISANTKVAMDESKLANATAAAASPSARVWEERARTLAGCENSKMDDSAFTGAGINTTGASTDDMMEQYFDHLEYCQAHNGAAITSAKCVLLKSNLDAWESDNGGANTLSRTLRRWFDHAGISIPRLSMTSEDLALEKKTFSNAIKSEQSTMCTASSDGKLGKAKRLLLRVVCSVSLFQCLPGVFLLIFIYFLFFPPPIFVVVLLTFEFPLVVHLFFYSLQRH